MRHEVPNHIQIEDKVLGPLTLRQLLILTIGVSVGYSLWSDFIRTLPGILDFIVGSIPFLIGCLFAFLRLEQKNFEDWCWAVTRFYFLPKIYIWQRIGK
jgi:PrgI family protein